MESLCGMYDFSIRDDNGFCGRGTSEVPDDAIKMAFSEFMERRFINLPGNSKVVSAGHFVLSEAVRNCEYELMERNAVAFHFAEKIPFMEDLTARSGLTIQIEEFLKRNEMEIRSFLCRSYEQVYVVASFGYRVRDGLGFCMGFGSSQDLNISIKKSRLEVLRNLLFFVDPSREDLNFAEKKIIERMSNSNIISLYEKLWTCRKTGDVLTVLGQYEIKEIKHPFDQFVKVVRADYNNLFLNQLKEGEL